MTTASLSDQFFNAEAKFQEAHDAYAAESAELLELEQQLLQYTEDHQALPENAKYVGYGNWRVFNGTISAVKRGEDRGYWVYVCNPTGNQTYFFEDVSDAFVFLYGYKAADDWHNAQAKAIAKEQSDEDKASRLTHPGEGSLTR